MSKEMFEKDIKKLVDNWLEMNGGLADITSGTPQYWATIKDLVNDLSPFFGE